MVLIVPITLAVILFVSVILVSIAAEEGFDLSFVFIVLLVALFVIVGIVLFSPVGLQLRNYRETVEARPEISC